MSKLFALLIAAAAVAAALVLLALGWRRLYVDAGAARTLRGRFLVAVAFFLALFAGYVERARAADAPPAAEAKPAALSLAEMQKAVEAVLQTGPPGNDWMDPDINPNVYAVLKQAGLIENAIQVMCYDRSAVPAKERGEELAALQKQLLDEKVEAGVIPEEVAGKITAIPAPQPGTPAEVRAYQEKVRRTARLLYKAGELDTAMIKKLEAATGIPIATLDPLKALKADVTYALHSRGGWNWPPEARQAYRDALVKSGIINKVTSHRGEMDRRVTVTGAAADGIKAQIEKAAKLIADPKYTVALKEEKGAKPVVLPKEPAELTAYRLNVRRAVRILLAEQVLQLGDAQAIESVLGLSLFGAVAASAIPAGVECYLRIDLKNESSKLPAEDRRKMREALARSGALTGAEIAKLDLADQRTGRY